ncbi:MAG TPA: cyclic nucleotide-binding domain-containing protein [Alphaproteobacteria bacterium]|nr:cyclic nucleotide-binding domain-containing protein [Alphaproteobacteria bacterium]
METKSLDQLIAAHPFFQGLSSDICALIAGCGHNVRFDAGQRIYRKGDPADIFYVIRHGRVALEMPSGGRPTVFETLGGDDILNASWLVPPYQCASDARAVETTRAIAFDAVCLRGKCDADHHVGYELMKRFVPVMVDRLSHARMQAMDLYSPAAAS